MRDHLHWLTILLTITSCGSPAEQEGDVAEWTVEVQLVLGKDDADSTQVFGRVAAAIGMPGGGTAVADGMSAVVRVFDEEGKQTHVFGRRGNGPGEFDFLSRLTTLAGDTLIAGSTNRVSYFNLAGDYVGGTKLDWSGVAQSPYFVEAAWPLTSDRYLLMLLTTTEGTQGSTELRRAPKMYVVASLDPTLVDTLGELGGLEQLQYEAGSGSETAIPLFPLETSHAVGQSHVVVGNNASDSVLWYDVAARQKKWVSLPLMRVDISDEARAAALASACDWASSEDLRRCERSLARLPAQSKYPFYDALAVDDAGAVWVRLPGAPSTDSGDTWHVASHDGRVHARVRLPRGMMLTDISANEIIAVHRDNLGVQSIHRFALTRASKN